MLNTDFCLWISTKPRTLSAPWVFGRSRWWSAWVLGLDWTWSRVTPGPGLSDFYSQPIAQTFVLTTDFSGSCSPLWARFGCFFPQIKTPLGVFVCFTQIFVLACNPRPSCSPKITTLPINLWAQHNMSNTSVLTKPRFGIITQYLPESRWEKGFAPLSLQSWHSCCLNLLLFGADQVELSGAGCSLSSSLSSGSSLLHPCGSFIICDCSWSRRAPQVLLWRRL